MSGDDGFSDIYSEDDEIGDYDQQPRYFELEEEPYPDISEL